MVVVIIIIIERHWRVTGVLLLRLRTTHSEAICTKYCSGGNVILVLVINVVWSLVR